MTEPDDIPAPGGTRDSVDTTGNVGAGAADVGVDPAGQADPAQQQVAARLAALPVLRTPEQVAARIGRALGEQYAELARTVTTLDQATHPRRRRRIWAVVPGIAAAAVLIAFLVGVAGEEGSIPLPPTVATGQEWSAATAPAAISFARQGRPATTEQVRGTAVATEDGLASCLRTIAADGPQRAIVVDRAFFGERPVLVAVLRSTTNGRFDVTIVTVDCERQLGQLEDVDARR